MSLLKFYKPYKKMLVFVIAGSLISAGVEITFPMIVRHILGTVLPARDMDGLWREGGLLFSLYCVCLVVTYLVYRCGRNMGVYIENDLRRSLFRHLESLDFAFFDGTKTGQLVSRVTGDISEIGNIVFQLPNLVMVCIVMMGGSAFFLFYINRVLAACVLFLVALKTADTVFLNRKMKNAFAETRRRMGILSSVTTEILGAIRVVKAYNGEKEAFRNFSEAAVELIREQQETFRYQAYLSGTVVFFSNAINLAIIVIGSVLIMNGLLAISDLVAFLMYLMLFIRPIMQLTVLTEQYQRSMAGFRRYEELMALVPDVRDGELILNKEDVCGDIHFEHVCFAYDEDTPVLHDFNLHIQSGETVALVGATGAGKSSIASLLLRFYDVTSGRILLDGTDIRRYSLESLRRNIGIVQQEAYLFSDSVADNIRIGQNDAGMEDVICAAERARADQFIRELPDGYDSFIGERGIKLSGGQKQRLALARIFLKKPPVLILDEATAAMDNETEKQVLEELNDLTAKRTVVMIAHRLASVRNADRIVVLHEGRIAEMGRHEDLIARKGMYFELYMAQFKKI